MIDIQNNSSSLSTELPSEDLLEHWAYAVFQHENTPEVEITLRLVDNAEMQALNKRYRGKDKPTNVLSFPAEIPKEIVLELPFLGDIILCVPVIHQEAEEQQKSELAHWAHMVVHGILHLLNYDHMNDHDAEIMEEKECVILRELGFENPYNDDEE